MELLLIEFKVKATSERDQWDDHNDDELEAYTMALDEAGSDLLQQLIDALRAVPVPGDRTVEVVDGYTPL